MWETFIKGAAASEPDEDLNHGLLLVHIPMRPRKRTDNSAVLGVVGGNTAMAPSQKIKGCQEILVQTLLWKKEYLKGHKHREIRLLGSPSVTNVSAMATRSCAWALPGETQHYCNSIHWFLGSVSLQVWITHIFWPEPNLISPILQGMSLCWAWPCWMWRQIHEHRHSSQGL